MKERNFDPTPDDENFLKELGKTSDLYLSQVDKTYEEFTDLFESAYDGAMNLVPAEDQEGAKREIIKQLKDILDSGYNPPEKERALRDFLKKIEGPE